MKCTRKLASLLLALVMVFALATTAFATGTVTTPTTGTITVAKPVADRTYTAYKIFDVVYDAEGHYSYTIDSSTNEWYGTVSTYAQDTAHGLTLTQVNGGDTYVVTTGNGFRAPDFAVALKAAVNGMTGQPLSGDANSVSVSGLPLGYYFVSSDTGALCNLTTTNPAVTIHDKNDMPFEKTADQTDVEVGQTVNYTITSKVPDYTGFAAYTYTVEDTMSKGLTFNQDVKVMVNGEDVTKDGNQCHLAYNAGLDPNSFTMTILILENQYPIGAKIEITYSAVVNEDAIAKTATNKAILHYTNDPSNTDKLTHRPPVIVNVYSSKIVIDKYETGNENKKLPGAEFALYKEVTPEGAAEATKMYYKWNGTGKKVEWVNTIDDATKVTTDANGAATFGGLADDTYYLVETKAPAGYNQLTEAKEVTVAGSITDTAKLSVTAKVANNTGTLLPSTGGMGTTVFYVLGAALVLGAVVLLVTKKRMSDANR